MFITETSGQEQKRASHKENLKDLEYHIISTAPK